MINQKNNYQYFKNKLAQYSKSQMIASLLLILAPITESYLIPSCLNNNNNLQRINRHRIVKLMNDQKSRQYICMTTTTLNKNPIIYKKNNENLKDQNNFNTDSDSEIYFNELANNIVGTITLKRDSIEQRDIDQNLLDSILKNNNIKSFDGIFNDYIKEFELTKKEDLNSISKRVTQTFNDLYYIDNEIKIMKKNNPGNKDLRKLEKIKRLVMQKDMCRKYLDHLKEDYLIQQNHFDKWELFYIACKNIAFKTK
eukprot:Mrub_08429.p1 GENE.Mrub_08429~~Mrub_08429.p1  ORF type:complete len:276 (-),score=35.78 Mrub_08429:8-769(-)